MKGQTIGYVRVSTIEQNPERQLDGISLDKVFIDKASGKSADRPQLRAMMGFAREGDVVIAHSLDRMARNLDDLRLIVKAFTDRGVKVEFVKEDLSFTGDDSPMATLLLSVMGAFAEFERALIRERQREGIAWARQRGVYKGRKPSLSAAQLQELRLRVSAGEAKTKLAREFRVSRETLYQYLRELHRTSYNVIVCSLRDKCQCDRRQYVGRDKKGSPVPMEFCCPDRAEELIEHIEEWPESATSGTTFKGAFIASVEVDTSRIRVLRKKGARIPPIEGILALPDEKGRATLEAHPKNRVDHANRDVRDCGKCLIARVVECHLANGCELIKVNTLSAKGFYESLGFTEVYKGTLVIAGDKAKQIVESVSMSEAPV
jgi:DNA invertase Pin-like site-specific DNA recombinase